MSSLEELRKRVRSKFKELGNDSSDDLLSDSYETFLNEEETEYSLSSFFERYCAFALSILSFMKNFKNKQMDEYLEIAGMKIKSPSVMAAAVLTFFMGLFGILPFIIIGAGNIATFVFGTFLFLVFIIYTYPKYKSDLVRIEAQQESLLAILYMTIYMRVNPIMENAILFASGHIHGPLGKDLKRIMWLVNMQKVNSINDAIAIFMPLWIKRNRSFVKAFVTMQEVLNQPTVEGQENILDKALNGLLNETFDTMKHYAHDLKMPVILINAFGLLLPLIGLITFPLLSVFMAGTINMSNMFFGYTIVLPALVYFFSQRIISKRPGAFSAPEISHLPGLPPKNSYLWHKKTGEDVIVPLVPLSLIVATLIMLPGLYHLFFITLPIYFQGLASPAGADLPAQLGSEYSLRAVLSVMTIPIGIAVGIFILLYGRSIQKKKLRDYIVSIEDDASVSLFQIANQFTENVPLEVGIEKFLRNYELLSLKKEEIYDFFSRIMEKMNKLGMTFEEAVFDKQQGVLSKFPSVLLKESIWIMVETSKKGNEIMYKILIKVSVYLSNLRKIRELIYDLLNDTVTSIKFQAKFMSPLISAIVASLSLVIVESLYKVFIYLRKMMGALTVGLSSSSSAQSYFTGMINFTKIVPPPLFQVLIGIYLIESVYLLMVLANGIENGFDQVEQDITTARGIMTAIIVYAFINIIVTWIFQRMLLPTMLRVGGV